ncbi:YncE family protein [Phenylobacterium montanum]|uniref:PQQ-binding-like beta-propeller repeat protein n=1 Tax=Phenylobacterium montanum TaxID=2823693 RepID=A0A975G1E5_9CAUL|nr:PQQ-binding-like beta-propeller repeat protein [Caulobacter sp. S6]QUD88792.1 PQQ-binding-like beta-propeller repeat protein [Caulobacter sp. S6]
MKSSPRLGALTAGLLAATSLAAVAHAAPGYAVTDRISIPDGGFDYASFDPVKHRVYVARADGVTAIDAESKAVTGKLTAAGRTHEPLVVNGGAELLVTDSTSNSAHLIDATTGKAIADIPTGKKPDAAVLDPATGLAVVANGASGDLTLIDVATRKATGSIAVGGGLEFMAPVGGGKLFVNVEDKNELVAVDLKSRKVLGRYPLKGCDGPTGLAYADKAGVVISACANNVAKVIDAKTGADLATLAIGKGPDAVIYDAKRELAFIPCGRDGVLDVVAVKGRKDVAVVAKVTTQPGARTGALDPETGKLYLPTAKYTLAPGSRPAPTPGTFEVLVVSPQ